MKCSSLLLSKFAIIRAPNKCDKYIDPLDKIKLVLTEQAALERSLTFASVWEPRRIEGAQSRTLKQQETPEDIVRQRGLRRHGPRGMQDEEPSFCARLWYPKPEQKSSFNPPHPSLQRWPVVQADSNVTRSAGQVPLRQNLALLLPQHEHIRVRIDDVDAKATLSDIDRLGLRANGFADAKETRLLECGAAYDQRVVLEEDHTS